ncbi:hypothetical protein [Paenibacillus cymbidii]|uniref:hypothetical protein n=1 Tax=Paenibacillus cymbidii TaxID=1639034 RepID=UPI0014369182|nr:hypothetical protein [Paenibacillus cymbidii]
MLEFNTVIDKMPNLKKFWEKNPDAKRRATSPEGKTYMAINDGLGYSNQQIWMYRMYQDLDTGEVKYGQVTSQYKKMIEYLNKFNKENLLVEEKISPCS